MKIDTQLYVELLEAEIRRLRARVEYESTRDRSATKPSPERRVGAVAAMLGVTAEEIETQSSEFHAPRNLSTVGEQDGD